MTWKKWTYHYVPPSAKVCIVCNRFIGNHLPWELIKCHETNPEWFDKEILNVKH